MTDATSRTRTTAPRAPRPRDADGTRSRLLDAAEALFGQKGVDGVRLREIAERAGATVPLLCHHYRDKETLYSAVIDRAMERFASLGWDVLQHAATIEARLEGLVSGLIEMLAADPAMTAVLHRELADGGERARPFAERWFRPLMEAAAEEIRQGQSRGEIRKQFDPDLLMLHVVSAAIYPFVAAPVVRVVWGSDPFAPDQLERRKRELIELLRPLVTA
jgi:TetR/AcrR family transcriptional regulator